MRILRTMLVFAILTGGVVASTPQGAKVSSAQARGFHGTWMVTMTEPPELKGTQHTLRIWDKDGGLAASFQSRAAAPVIEATGLMLDGDLLILTFSHQAKPALLENGTPLWAIFTLSLDGDALKLVQTMERSATLKRGIGRKQSSVRSATSSRRAPARLT